MNQSSGEDGWWRFLELCTEFDSTEKLDVFFDLFLTIEEKKVLSGRYVIVRELLKGDRTQREIADEFDVSIAKITRGSNSLKRIGEEMRSYLAERMS